MKHLHLGERAEAKRLIVSHHYSGLFPSGTVLIATWHEDGGLFGDAGPAVAACLFGQPASRWSEPVLELTRLVRTPDCDESLSGLVSLTVAWVRRKRLADVVTSFADPGAGHHGGIYQACSWNYHGQREARMDGVVVNGKFMAGRAANHAFGTQSPRLLIERGLDVQAHYDIGKHLYWKPLNRIGRKKAERLGLRSMPYPKPAVEVAA